MNRIQLTNALQKIAEESGYAFRTGPARTMPANISSYPTAWLEPPVLKSKEGRRHGRIVYSLRLHILRDGLRLPPAERTARQSEAEESLLEIFTLLSEDPAVALVDELRISTAEFSLTPHGEISATAEADVETLY